MTWNTLRRLWTKTRIDRRPIRALLTVYGTRVNMADLASERYEAEQFCKAASAKVHAIRLDERRQTEKLLKNSPELLPRYPHCDHTDG
jgi:hypothetical protein